MNCSLPLPQLSVPDLLYLEDPVAGEDPPGMALVPVLPGGWVWSDRSGRDWEMNLSKREIVRKTSLHVRLGDISV